MESSVRRSTRVVVHLDESDRRLEFASRYSNKPFVVRQIHYTGGRLATVRGPAIKIDGTLSTAINRDAIVHLTELPKSIIVELLETYSGRER